MRSRDQDILGNLLRNTTLGARSLPGGDVLASYLKPALRQAI